MNVRHYMTIMQYKYEYNLKANDGTNVMQHRRPIIFLLKVTIQNMFALKFKR